MSVPGTNKGRSETDTAPGDEFVHDGEIAQGLKSYLIGFGLAGALTVASFTVLHSPYVWAPGIPVALIVFAIAQMGVHLIFFLHVSTGPDSTNNVMALAFGVLIVILVVGGSLWIMGHLNNNMMPMDKHMQMRMQR